MTGGRIEELSHTADIGFRVSAGSLGDLFRMAARGLISALGLPPEGAAPADRGFGRVSLRRDDLERLLVAWLRELLRRIRTERGVPRIESLDVTRREDGQGSRLEAVLSWALWGDRGPEREIKGVTYHGLEVRRQGDRWHATVVLDV